eukprot:m.31143 g.31143  ORF g.31143 m.31143 type:complete len:114 (+) comp4851_c0_seq1:232-573(+)
MMSWYMITLVLACMLAGASAQPTASIESANNTIVVTANDLQLQSLDGMSTFSFSAVHASVGAETARASSTEASIAASVSSAMSNTASVGANILAVQASLTYSPPVLAPRPRVP